MLSLDRSNGWNTSVFQILLIAWAPSSWCHPSCSVFFFNLGKFSIFLFLFRTYTSIFFVMTDSKDCLTLYVPYHNQVHKQTNKMHFLYVSYNFCTTLHISNNIFFHHQEFMIYFICSSVQLCTNRADRVNHEFLMMNEKAVRNM